MEMARIEMLRKILQRNSNNKPVAFREPIYEGLGGNVLKIIIVGLENFRALCFCNFLKTIAKSRWFYFPIQK
jgi:hypothetical protein